MKALLLFFLLAVSINGQLPINVKLGSPISMDFDSIGNVYISDSNFSQIFQISPNYGNLIVFAGTGSKSFSGDGGLAYLASFSNQGIAVSKSQNLLYICDSSNNRIRTINLTTNIISTFAGNGVVGFSGDGGIASLAQLNNPQSLAFDNQQNLYISDMGNQRIRKISAGTNIISTICGNGTSGYFGDNGLAINALINNVVDIFINGSQIYLVDQNNQRVRVISSSGNITTVAGNGTMGNHKAPGNIATQSELNLPQCVVTDNKDNIFIGVNAAIEKINPSALIGPYLGGNAFNYSGDGEASVSAQAGSVCSCVIDPNGNLLFGDCFYGAIRTINKNPPNNVTLIAGTPLAAPITIGTTGISPMNLTFTTGSSTTGIPMASSASFTEIGCVIIAFVFIMVFY